MRPSITWFLSRGLLLSSMLTSAIAIAQTQTDENAANPVYVDVRSWAEYQYNGIEGDLHVHYPDIVEGLSAQVSDKQAPIYVYCGAGGRAEQARNSLLEAGYVNVTNLGGIADVKASRGLD